MRDYHARLTPDDNGMFPVICSRLPIVTTFGVTEAEALGHAVDAIGTALASMIDDGEDIPRRGRADKGIPVRLPAMTVLKLQLYRALRDAGITRAELARRLAWNRESVDRLFRLDHRSRLEQIEAAFAALGQRVEISVPAAARRHQPFRATNRWRDSRRLDDSAWTVLRKACVPS